MRINLLAASDGTPLTKTFFDFDGEIHTNPYPFVKTFDSFQYDVENLEEFITILKTHAEKGHCLLKGTLDKKLEAESRAGHTNAFERTNWLALDLDFDSGFDSIDQFLESINSTLAHCSYVLHHSSSSGIKRKAGLSAHIYIMLDQSYSPDILKQWLIYTNLKTPELRRQIKLAKNGLSLIFPLDITTCQNDKLLFIADPKVRNMEDPMAGQRFVLVDKNAPAAKLRMPNLNAQALRDEQDALVAELRAAAGLKKRAPKYKRGGAFEILLNPDEAVVTDVKEERGFVYLNINGGDSWAYYFRPDNPELLHNFKGEPVVRLADIAPEFYKEYMASNAGTAEKKIELQPFVFRDPNTDTYWNGVYNATDEVIEAINSVKTKDRMKDFMAQYGAPMPDPIEDWELTFDPTTNVVFNPGQRWINQFKPTTYLKDRMPSSPKIPRVICKVLRSICVDEETFEHFINWLAFIVQTRQKTGTAWIFHGVPGTGKGILQEKILIPLFGKQHVSKILTQNLQDSFNSYMETAIILILDEVRMDQSFVREIDRMKNIITDDTTTIRRMRTEAYLIRNFVNLVIATNHPDPIPINLTDRRFNIAPAQEVPLDITHAEVNMIEDELAMFAGFLRNYEVDEQKARTIMKNQAREQMIQASETTVDQLFREFKAGNLDFFLGNLRSRPSLSPNNTYLDYEKTIKRWISERGTEFFVSRDELMYCYRYLINSKMEPAKFGRMCSIHNLKPQPGRLDGVLLRGFHQYMHSEDTETIDTILGNNVTELRKIV